MILGKSGLAIGVVMAFMASPLIIAAPQTLPGWLQSFEGTYYPVVSGYRWEIVHVRPNGDVVAKVYAKKERPCAPTGYDVHGVDRTVQMHALFSDGTHTPMVFTRARMGAVNNPAGAVDILIGVWTFNFADLSEHAKEKGIKIIGAFPVTSHNCGGPFKVVSVQNTLYLPGYEPKGTTNETR